MNFGQILDAVCDNNGIPASSRTTAKDWVVYRHAWIWAANNWTFKQATGDITFTADQQAADAPTDVQSVFAVYDATGQPLTGIRDLRRFFDLYNTLGGTGGGGPEAYTVVDGQVLVGPQGDGSVGMIVYQKALPSLVDDDDETGLPAGFDLALVHGGKAEGYKMLNVPLSQTFDADFTAAVTAMENDWLEAVRETGERSGAFRPGTSVPAYR